MISSLHKYGWRPEIPDARDHVFKSPFIHSAFLRGSLLPSSVDMRKYCSPVENQGILGSCTGNAIVGGLELLENKNLDPLSRVDLSRLFVYYGERDLEGTVLQDSGAFIRDGMKFVNQVGVCPEPLWPYDPDQFTVKPADVCYLEASAHKLVEYQSVTNLNDMQSALAQGFPVVFGISVYESFESDAVAKTGIVPMPNYNTESNLGGHAVCAVGYDLTVKTILVRNSWGPEWGMGGYFTLPFQYVTDLADDMWCMKK
jgi:C1A family cysteine protease